ncbi:MAG: hypothetical protein G01um101420_451 [Parcubacteria group bacterium Gr01-1014_20]|nr:MAG: hypothetical protein G01um101420_451 [Parcubacteria group bacterium Gr01-1014_20]
MSITSKDGFIALTSAVVIAVLLLAITLSLGLTGFFARFNILAAEYKERSLSLAEGCAASALLKLEVDSTYTGNETITVANSTCDILTIIPTANPIVVRARATFPQNTVEKTFTNLVVTVSNPDLDIISWKEVPNH